VYVADKCILGPVEYRNVCPVLVTVSESSLIKIKGKANVHTMTCNEGTEGEWRFSSTLSLISALDVGGWLTPRLP
jgi:hypothetical protein